MTYSVLGIDQSMTSTGWAHFREGDKKPTWGKYTLPNWADDEGRFLWKWFSWLGHKVTELQVTHLYLEHTFNPQDHHENLTEKIAQYGQIGMADCVRHLCAEKGQPITFELVTTRQWRVPWLGNEEPPKGLVKQQRRAWLKEKSLAACHARGWMVDCDDVADALGIMTFAITCLDPRFAVQQGPLFRRQQSNFEKEERELR